MSNSIEKRIRTGSEVERFHASYVPIPWSGCWIWLRSTDDEGYGLHYFDGKKHRAHRRNHELFSGPIHDGLLVCHRCDTPACVNPAHLFLGSQQDNLQDAMQKRRFAVGEKNNRAKLTAEQVAFIRASQLPTSQLVSEFGVSKWSINRIKRGATCGASA